MMADQSQATRRPPPFPVFSRQNSGLTSHNASSSSLQSIRKHHHHHANSSSSLMLSKSNVEKQLQSLVIDDEGTPQETEELLQQTFEQLDVENRPSKKKVAGRSRPVPTLKKNLSSQTIMTTATTATTASTRSTSNIFEELESSANTHFHTRGASEGSKLSSHFDSGVGVRRQVYPASTLAFHDNPVVIGRISSGFYIPTPTNLQHYIDPPEKAILQDMLLPFPFRKKEPVSMRLVRMDDERLSKDVAKKARRIKTKATRDSPTPAETGQEASNQSTQRTGGLSDKTIQEIMSWMPDQHTQWQPPEALPSVSALQKQTNVLHVTEAISNRNPAYVESQLHPLDNSNKNTF